MFEPGIGPGIRSERFGTWSLITFLLLFATPFVGLGLMWLPLLACGAATLGAIGYGLVGMFIEGQRRAALQGLLKAAVPTVVVGSFGLFLWALSSANFG